MGDYAWYMDNTWIVDENYAHPVGQKLPNNFGLYDMCGNAAEWCNDWFDENYYSVSPSVDPPGPAIGTDRVIRADGVYTGGYTGYSVYRREQKPEWYRHDLGLRIALDPSPPQCGDGTCNGDESCFTCTADCGECPPYCGDGTCNGDETCDTCPEECGECPPECGDGECNGDETCVTCNADCGDCIPTGDQITVDLGNGVSMILIRIDAGIFTMGDSQGIGDPDETPVHEVTITSPFYIGRYEVTQAQWKQVMGTTPWQSYPYVIENDEAPAVIISWNDTQGFNEAFHTKTGYDVRMPTEAEWEYACRAGTSTMYYFANNSTDLSDYAWWFGNADDVGENYAHLTGRKIPNAWDLNDMHGNVWEYCSDWYADNYYTANTIKNPSGPTTGTVRVIRGGAWSSYADECRSANRDSIKPTWTPSIVGFRIALDSD